MVLYAQVISSDDWDIPFGPQPEWTLPRKAVESGFINLHPKQPTTGVFFCQIGRILDWLTNGDALCAAELRADPGAVYTKLTPDDVEQMWVGDLSEVSTWEYLVSRGVKVGVKEALFWSVESNCLEVAGFVLAQGAEAGAWGNYALLCAADNKNWDMVKLLLTHGADVRVNDDAVLKAAVLAGNLDMAAFALDKGAAPNADILVQAAADGHLPILKLLAARGAALAGTGALKKAAYYGHLDVVEFLVTNGVDLAAEGPAALEEAAWQDRLQVVRYLTTAMLKQGVDLSRNYDPITLGSPVERAAGRGLEEVVRFFASVGVFPSEGTIIMGLRHYGDLVKYIRLKQSAFKNVLPES